MKTEHSEEINLLNELLTFLGIAQIKPRTYTRFVTLPSPKIYSGIDCITLSRYIILHNRR